MAVFEMPCAVFPYKATGLDPFANGKVGVQFKDIESDHLCPTWCNKIDVYNAVVRPAKPQFLLLEHNCLLFLFYFDVADVVCARAVFGHDDFVIDEAKRRNGKASNKKGGDDFPQADTARAHGYDFIVT